MLGASQFRFVRIDAVTRAKKEPTRRRMSVTPARAVTFVRDFESDWKNEEPVPGVRERKRK